MALALVLGDNGSGLTTFVGLLYTAQVRYGIETEDEFRFHADRESINALGQIYGAIGDGHFPVAEAEFDERPLEFSLGFRRGRLPWGSRQGPATDPAFDVVNLRVGGMLAEDVVAIYHHDAVLTQPPRELLSSPVVIPLIDASRLTPKGAPVPDRVTRFDVTLSATLGLIDRAIGTERQRRARRMFPLFVATKLDRMPRETLQELGGPSTTPEQWSPGDRAVFGQHLLGQYLPKTSSFLQDMKAHHSVIAPVSWYFSYVGTTTDPGGEPRIARHLRIPEGGWEPVYPYTEYRALLTRLGDLAHQLPHPAFAV